MRLKNPKAKGSAFERYIAEIIRGFGFEDTFRTPMSGAIKDIQELRGDLRGKSWPFFTEIKKTEKTKFYKWYTKASDECGSKIPIIIWGKNRSEPFIFLTLSDFMHIITNKSLIKEKYNKPQKPQKSSLQETKDFMFSKFKQSHRKK